VPPPLPRIPDVFVVTKVLTSQQLEKYQTLSSILHFQLARLHDTGISHTKNAWSTKYLLLESYI